jgi:hypothetical protein
MSLPKGFSICINIGGVKVKGPLNESNYCVDCDRDTSMGSGLWVNRMGWEDGWMCRDCYVWPCDICGEEVAADDLEMVVGKYDEDQGMFEQLAVGVYCCEGKLPKNYYDQEVK